MNVLCPCGTEFTVANWQLKRGRGKYCSKSCMYEHRVRPSGLTYDIKVENPAWIRPGQRLSPETEFQPGIRSNPDGEFDPGHIPANYKGDQVGYHGLHSWVRRQKGIPEICEQCSSTENVQWSNISWEYRRELDDWQQLCYSCHREYDMQGNWGAAAAQFEHGPNGYGARV